MTSRHPIRTGVGALLLAGFMPSAAATAADSTAPAPFATISPAELELSARSSERAWVRPNRFRALRLSEGSMDALLAAAPPERPTRNADRLEITLPAPDGSEERFAVWESPVMHPELATWMRDQGWPMRTFKGESLDHPSTTVRLDWGGPAGFHATVLSPRRTYSIDPYWQGNRTLYVSYFKHDYPATGKAFECEVAGTAAASMAAKAGPGTGGFLRTYRLAVAATGEYTSFHGGTMVAGQAAIVTTVNRVNQVYERDLSVRMVLVANNNSLVYTNPATDPYTNSSGVAMLSENQANVDAVIGSTGYDIGHVVSTGGGGVALLGVPCQSGLKAQGVTGSANPVGDPFDIDYVAHEMGHQWGGNHTFNSTTGSCGGGNRNAATAYEPGSGSTIQAYAGICGADNLQANSDDFFHGVSLDEMLTYIAGGGACSADLSAANPNAPTVNAGLDYTVPASTPFELTAAGNDLDGHALTYSWEEFDLGPAAAPADPDNGSSPIFRAWDPTPSPIRVFPRLEDLLAGTLSAGEKLPSTDRTMTFRVTVRDNAAGGGRVGEDVMSVTSTTGAGPFAVTSPNGGEAWNGTQMVSWSVAGSDAGLVGAASVDILLSTDGGLTFPTVLAAATPNDGSQSVTLPAVSTTAARIKVKASDNVFFDISDGDFLVGATAQCRQPALALADNGTVTDDLIIASGTSINDLNLSLSTDHTWVGDLEISLQHVDTGTTVTVIDRPGVPATTEGCSGDGIVATLDDEGASPVEDQCAGTVPAISGSFTPNNPLSAFDAESIAGTWRLSVTDHVPADTGTLAEWCLLAVTQPQAADLIFMDGFESGNMSSWSSSEPPLP